jgi:hypothetical protein
LARWFSPGWYKLRRLLLSRFDVSTRAVVGDWTDVVGALVAKHRAATALDEARAALSAQLAGIDASEARPLLAELHRPEGVAARLRPLRDLLAAGGATARAVTDVAIDTKSLEDELASFTAWEHLDLSTLRGEIGALERDSVALTPLRGPLLELDRASREVSSLLRRHVLDGTALEALVARRAIATALRERAPDLVLAEGDIDAFGLELASSATDLRDANARALVELVRSHFVEKAQLAQTRRRDSRASRRKPSARIRPADESSSTSSAR